MAPDHSLWRTEQHPSPRPLDARSPSRATADVPRHCPVCPGAWSPSVQNHCVRQHQFTRHPGQKHTPAPQGAPCTRPRVLMPLFPPLPSPSHKNSVFWIEVPPTAAFPDLPGFIHVELLHVSISVLSLVSDFLHSMLCAKPHPRCGQGLCCAQRAVLQNFL